MKYFRKILSGLALSFLLFANIGVVYSQTVVDLGSVNGPTTPQSPAPASAPTTYTAGGGVPCNNSAGKICNPIAAKSIDGLISSLVSIVKFVAGIALVVYFILAGLKYVMARGDEGQIKKAHEMLKWTAVGGAILLGAEVIQKLIVGTISQLGTGL